MNDEDALELLRAKEQERLNRARTVANSDGARAIYEIISDDLVRNEAKLEYAQTNEQIREAVGERKYIKQLLSFFKGVLLKEPE